MRVIAMLLTMAVGLLMLMPVAASDIVYSNSGQFSHLSWHPGAGDGTHGIPASAESMSYEHDKNISVDGDAEGCCNSMVWRKPFVHSAHNQFNDTAKPKVKMKSAVASNAFMWKARDSI